MKKDITATLVDEHRLILRMLAILEHNARLTATKQFDDYGFYLDALDFIRSYADRFHHAKEEDVLFVALVENGMPRENSPIAAMLAEHETGRAYVRAMERAAREALAGGNDTDTIAANALLYVELLREHIHKEDHILYPLAERVIPDGMRDRIIEGYGKAEALTPPGFAERYEQMVSRLEAAELSRAA